MEGAKMKEKLRVGVLGMTHDHLWGNLADLNASPMGELVAAADPNQELRDKAQKQFACPQVFESYEELLQKVDVDAVYIYSDHVTSADLTVMVAESGKHIMVEKAMAATLADAERMFAAASRNNVQLMINWPFAWDPGLQKAIELVESGAIGRLYYVKHRGAHGGPMEFGHSHFFYDWLYDDRLGGGGAIIDYGCYGAALARYLLGQPSKVSAVAGHLAKEYVTLDDNAIFVMQWSNAMAQMEASWTHIGHLNQRFSVFLGTQGTVYLQAYPKKSVSLATDEDKDGTEVELTSPHGDMQNATSYFLTRLLENRPIEGICSPQVGRDAQEIVEAAKLSAAQERVIALPLPVTYLRKHYA
jgi:predicted dehydrogenase